MRASCCDVVLPCRQGPHGRSLRRHPIHHDGSCAPDEGGVSVGIFIVALADERCEDTAAASQRRLDTVVARTLLTRMARGPRARWIGSCKHVGLFRPEGPPAGAGMSRRGVMGVEVSDTCAVGWTSARQR